MEVGTRVPYTEYLNDGHSKQAPAGFIDKAENRANLLIDKLGTEIAKQIDRFLKKNPLEKIMVYRLRTRGGERKTIRV